jgi:hypothetical protein
MTDFSMDWVFDDPNTFITMSACKHTVYGEKQHNNDGRWNVSNIHWYWREGHWWYNRKDIAWRAYGIDDRPERYVYPIGAFSSPEWWAGWPDNSHGVPSMFELIPTEVLADARVGRVLLLIDNLNEGFHIPRLWEFFHRSCEQFHLPPSCIVYLNSNELEQASYSSWCAEQHMDQRINIINFCHLMYQQRVALPLYGSPSWDQHLEHKTNNDIKLYNCLNRVSRLHREYLLLQLIQADLFRHGLVSHDMLRWHWEGSDINPRSISRANALLPAVVDDGDFGNNKAMTQNSRIYLDSWLSVITETHADDDPGQLFISEKLWKPIHCRHPFIVLGNPGTMENLRDRGYQTFEWVEMDRLPFKERVSAILEMIQDLRQRDRLAWWREQEEVCEHNYQLFMKQDFFASPAADEIIKLYRGLQNDAGSSI